MIGRKIKLKKNFCAKKLREFQKDITEFITGWKIEKAIFKKKIISSWQKKVFLMYFGLLSTDPIAKIVHYVTFFTIFTSLFKSIEFYRNPDVTERFNLWIRVQRPRIHQKDLRWSERQDFSAKFSLFMSRHP